MNEGPHASSISAAAGAGFRTTHWSQVLAVGEGATPAAAAALEELCRTYWYPLYAYVRRKGHGPEDAKDITQEFFARLLRLNSLRDVSREKGRFRTFLLVSLNHFIADHWDKARAAKRGGGQPALSLDEADAEARYASDLAVDLTPEKLFDRRWALTVLNNALNRLQGEFAEAGKSALFDELKQFLSSSAAPGRYEELAPGMKMTPQAVSMAVYRLRQRYAELVRSEVAETVAGPGDLEAELNYLFEVAGQ